MGGSPVAPGVIKEGEANNSEGVADEGGIVGEGVGGRVDWASNRTAAKSRPPLREPFHPPVESPAIINRPVLSAATAFKPS